MEETLRFLQAHSGSDGEVDSGFDSALSSVLQCSSRKGARPSWYKNYYSVNMLSKKFTDNILQQLVLKFAGLVLQEQFAQVW